MEVHADPSQVPYGAPPGIIIHVLRENRRPVGFAQWPDEAEAEKPKRKRKKKEKK